MKKLPYPLKVVVGIVIGLPTILITLVFFAFAIPIDMFRFRRTQYFKNLKAKYKFNKVSSDIVKIYNAIAEGKLDFEYCSFDDYEYFLRDGELLLPGFSLEYFAAFEGDWYFITDGEKPTEELKISRVIENELELLSPEHMSMPAKLLMLKSNAEDDAFETAKSCPYFCCVEI